MIKTIFKRLVYTPQDLSPRFTCRTQIFIETQKDRPDLILFILAFLLDRGMQRGNWLQPRTIVCCIHSLSNGVAGETMNYNLTK